MTETTNQKIEVIKTIKFGVEVEMYDIRRQDAANIVGDYFGTADQVDRGERTYNRWVAYDASGRKWQFLSDSSIRDYNDGCELVTPLLTYDDIPTLQDIIRLLRKGGGRSDPNHNCGVHIHVDIGDMDTKHLMNLVNMIASHEELIKDAINIDSSRAYEWSKAVDPNFLSRMNEEKPKTMEEMKKCWYESMGYDPEVAQEDHYNRSRYHLLNLHSLWQGKGVEFRCFQFANPSERSDGSGRQRRGGLHAGELKAYIQLCLGMVATAGLVNSVKSKATRQQTENPQYSMMRFLRKLGLKGGEFKTLRELMFRHLEGNARVRHYEEIA